VDGDDQAVTGPAGQRPTDGTGDDGTASLRTRVHGMLDRHWQSEGYAAPNERVYPWQWLWDSCFHVLVWAELGRPDRAVAELGAALHTQAPDGFVPHMNYQRDPDRHTDLWGRPGASSITQPPMYGHAVAVLLRSGIVVPEEVVDRAAAGLRFLLTVRRRDPSGLVRICHPWETGADDSPRWDDRCPGGWDVERWRAHKNELLDRIERSPAGSPLDNPDFPVAAAGFSALVAFNALELVEVCPDAGLEAAAAELVDALDERWDEARRTWVDAGPTERGSGRVRSVEALLPLLVTRREEAATAALASLVDPAAHGAAFGPTGVHRDEAVYAPRTYWRGPAWPQLSYLLWLAASRRSAPEAAALAAALRRGADRSGLAEYWDPDTGEGLGAVPQSWAGVAVLV
jgi:hypothetical protein